MYNVVLYRSTAFQAVTYVTKLLRFPRLLGSVNEAVTRDAPHMS